MLMVSSIEMPLLPLWPKPSPDSFRTTRRYLGFRGSGWLGSSMGILYCGAILEDYRNHAFFGRLLYCQIARTLATRLISSTAKRTPIGATWTIRAPLGR